MLSIKEKDSSKNPKPNQCKVFIRKTLRRAEVERNYISS